MRRLVSQALTNNLPRYAASYGDGRTFIRLEPLKAALIAIRQAIRRNKPQKSKSNPRDGEWIGARQDTPNPIRAHRGAKIAEEMESNLLASKIELRDAAETGLD